MDTSKIEYQPASPEALQLTEAIFTAQTPQELGEAILAYIAHAVEVTDPSAEEMEPDLLATTSVLAGSSLIAGKTLPRLFSDLPMPELRLFLAGAFTAWHIASGPGNALSFCEMVCLRDHPGHSREEHIATGDQDSINAAMNFPYLFR